MRYVDCALPRIKQKLYSMVVEPIKYSAGGKSVLQKSFHFQGKLGKGKTQKNKIWLSSLVKKPRPVHFSQLKVF